MPCTTLVKVLTPSSISVNVGSVPGDVGNDFVYPNDVALGSSSGLVCFRMITVAQLLRFVDAGAMKSLSAAVNESEDRLFRYALPNDVHVPVPPVRASKSSCASPNVRGEIAPSPSASAAKIDVVLIDPVALPAAVRFALVLQQGAALDASHCAPGPRVVSHRDTNRTGFVPPWERSYWMSRSPAVRTGVTPLPETVLDWLNSKSMFVVPEGSCTRCQNRFRNLRPAGVVSRWTPKVSRSLLFGGMLPLTTLGTAVSSLVPFPKELSPLPDGVSALRVSVTVAQSIDGAGSPTGEGSSTLRFASVSISKLLPV